MKKCYAICYNPEIENSVAVMEKLKSVLSNYEMDFKVFNIDNLDRDCDFAFIIGGDGTLLKATRFYSKYNVSVFGINLGHLGFLSQAGISDLQSAVKSILNSDYKTENRLMLKSGNYIALNDFVIKGKISSRVSNFQLEIDGNFVCEYFADGIIVSTPTGSTAYGMAAGGPVLTPDTDAIVIVPICPHTFSARPIVVSSSSKIKIIAIEIILFNIFFIRFSPYLKHYTYVCFIFIL
jgi:NAD+ kinase